MPRTGDLVERVDQVVVVVWLKRDVEVSHGAWRRTKALPVTWDSIICVLHTDVTPGGCYRHRGASDGHGGEDDEHREIMVGDGHRGTFAATEAIYRSREPKA